MNYPVPKQEYKVLVRCFTYNQSKYIEDALNGFAMQQTNFPFACIVMDDASTDGEQEVIKVWMERECDMSKAETIDIPTSVVIIVPHKINVSCSFAFYLLKQNLYKKKEEKMRHVTPWREKCEYEAMCEGDDYWIDPLKLQKQVDVMDANPNCSLCHSAFYFNEVKKSELFKNSIYQHKIDIINGIIGGNQYRIQTNTVLYRTSDLTEVLQSDPFLFNSAYFLMGDTQLWVALLQMGNVCYIESPTAVYRVLQGSACRSLDMVKKFRFDLSCSELRLYLIEKYNIEYDNKRQLVAEYNKNLLRYRLFDFSFKPLYRPTLLSQLAFLFLKNTRVYRLLQSKLYDKYSNGNF